ncbi:MAG: winged helix-turn-helix domain-containing protein [Candidatus Helarchaeota archaeon]
MTVGRHISPNPEFLPQEILEKELDKWINNHNSETILTIVDKIIGQQNNIREILEELKKKQCSFTELKKELNLNSKILAQKLRRLKDYGHVEKRAGRRGQYSITCLGELLLNWINETKVKDINQKHHRGRRISLKKYELHVTIRQKRMIQRQIRCYIKELKLGCRNKYLIEFFYVLMKNLERSQTLSSLKQAYREALIYISSILHEIDAYRENLVPVLNELSSLFGLNLDELNQD